MAIPNVSVSVNQFGISLVPPQSGNTPLLLGTSSSGPWGQLSTLASIQVIESTLGNGPLADKAALDISTGADEVLAWRMFDGSIYGTAIGAGSNSIQVPNSAGNTAGTGQITFKGVAGTYSPAIRITTAAVASTSYMAFAYSLDGGNSWASTNTTVASGSSGTNVNTFAGAGVLDVASVSGFAGAGTLQVVTATSTVYITYTGTSGNTFTGCTTLNSGAGVLATGGGVAQTAVQTTSATSYALGNSGITAVLSSNTETASLWVVGDTYTATGIHAASTAGTGTVTFSGSPVAPYGNQIGSTTAYTGPIVQITTSSGTSTTAQFNISLDGGQTYTTPQNIPGGAGPGTYLIPNTGLTVTFTGGATGTGVWVTGDTVRATITGTTGYAYNPNTQSAYTLMQVGATGAAASAKGSGTFAPGTTAVLGTQSTGGAYANAGTGNVLFTGAITNANIRVSIYSAGDGSSTNGAFNWSVGGSWTTDVANPGNNIPTQLGTSGIYVTFVGATTAGYFTAAAFVAGDVYGIAQPAPIDTFGVRIQITTAGTAEGGAQYIVSFDGGNTFSSPTPLGTSNSINLGYGLTMTAADYGGVGATKGFQVGDLYSFGTYAPPLTTTDVSNVLAILQGNAAQWGWLHVIGRTGGVTSAAVGMSMTSLFSTLDGIMNTWLPVAPAASGSNPRFGAYAFMESPPDSTSSSIDAALITAAGTLSGTGHVTIGAGDCAVVSPITGFQQHRNAAWLVSARCCAVPIGHDLGNVQDGPLVGVTQLYRDENQTPGLDAVGYATLRTISGISGYFITNGNIIAPSGSNLYLAQYRRVIDQAAYLSYQALVQYLNAQVRVVTGGTIDPRDAAAIQNNCYAKIMQGLTGQVSGVNVVVDQTHDILADSTLPVAVSVVPLGYSKYIQCTIGFTNAALQALAS